MSPCTFFLLMNRSNNDGDKQSFRKDVSERYIHQYFVLANAKFFEISCSCINGADFQQHFLFMIKCSAEKDNHESETIQHIQYYFTHFLSMNRDHPHLIYEVIKCQQASSTYHFYTLFSHFYYKLHGFFKQFNSLCVCCDIRVCA